MEETKTMEEKQPKLSYEDLEKVAAVLQQRLINTESKLKGIDYTAIRLNYLFKVIENAAAFSPEFVERAVKEVEDILTIKEQEDNQA